MLKSCLLIFLAINFVIPDSIYKQIKITNVDFDDINLFLETSSDGIVHYQWQISEEDCDNWDDLTESPALMIVGVFETKNGDYEGIEFYATKDIEHLDDYGLSISTGNSSSPNIHFESTSLSAGLYYMVYSNTNWNTGSKTKVDY